jgi:diadenosine tetraphosphate (Ap4A) HIT family hydrolase
MTYNIITDLEQAQENKIAPWDDLDEDLTDYHVAVFRDRFPVAKGHLLFVPKYNVHAVIMDCFEMAVKNVMRSMLASTWEKRQVRL